MFVTIAAATQVRYRSVEQLGSQSTAVVAGKVTSIRSYWNPQHTKIFTETQIQVDKAYKGAAVSTVRVVQLGGVVDGMRVTVSGALHWTEQEEVLLFLEPYANGTHQVSGFSQGKFQIERDATTGTAYVKRPALEGAEILGATSQDGDSAAGMESVPLDRFVERALGRR